MMDTDRNHVIFVLGSPKEYNLMACRGDRSSRTSRYRILGLWNICRYNRTENTNMATTRNISVSWFN